MLNITYAESKNFILSACHIKIEFPNISLLNIESPIQYACLDYKL